MYEYVYVRVYVCITILTWNERTTNVVFKSKTFMSDTFKIDVLFKCNMKEVLLSGYLNKQATFVAFEQMEH